MSREDIRKRIDDRVSKFQIGDKINCWIDSAEVDATIASIISIDGRKAKVETPFGEFTTDLTTARKRGL